MLGCLGTWGWVVCGFRCCFVRTLLDLLFLFVVCLFGVVLCYVCSRSCLLLGVVCYLLCGVC